MWLCWLERYNNQPTNLLPPHYLSLLISTNPAVGAVWGFSEIVTLRTPETNKIWSPISIAVGVVFSIRWFLHLIKFVQSERESVSAKSQVQVDETRFDEVADLDEFADDLQLKETASTEWNDNDNTMMELHTSMEVNENLEDHSSSDPSKPASPTPKNPTTPQKRHNKESITINQMENPAMTPQKQHMKELITRGQTT